MWVSAFALLVLGGAFALPSSVSAAAIYSQTGSSIEYNQGAGQAYVWFLGTGLSGSLDDVYLTVKFGSSSGYIRTFHLLECTTEDYGGPGSPDGDGCQNHPLGYIEGHIAMSGTGSVPEYEISFSANEKKSFVVPFGTARTNNPCNPGVNCTGAAGAITLDPTKFYMISAVGCSGSSAGFGACGSARSFVPNAAPVLVRDFEGTPLCARKFTGSSTMYEIDAATCVESPYVVLADTDGVLITAGYGYFVPASGGEDSLFDVVAATTVCGDRFAPTSSSSLIDNIANGIARAFCVAGGYMIIPSQDSIDTLVNQKNLLLQKTPFKEGQEFLSLWEGYDPGSASFTFIESTVELVLPDGTVANLLVLSSASFYQYVEPSQWATLRTISGYLIRLLTVFWIFRKVKGWISRTT